MQPPSLDASASPHVSPPQAELYSCWAESVLLKFRGCTCPGCAALAIQAVRMAHIQATRLFGKVDRVKQAHPERWRAVGQVRGIESNGTGHEQRRAAESGRRTRGMDALAGKQ
jgi:hypothetical protein